MSEFVIWVFVLLMMISGILWFGKAYDLKIQCHMAARYLAWAHAQQPETDMSTDVILERVAHYYPMTENQPQFVPLDQTATFSATSLNTSGPSAFGFDLSNEMSGMFGTNADFKGWEVSATYNPGGILDSTLPGGTHVRSQHAVVGGAWHKKQIDGDNMIKDIKEGLYNWSTNALGN